MILNSVDQSNSAMHRPSTSVCPASKDASMAAISAWRRSIALSTSSGRSVSLLGSAATVSNAPYQRNVTLSSVKKRPRTVRCGGPVGCSGLIGCPTRCDRSAKRASSVAHVKSLKRSIP